MSLKTKMTLTKQDNGRLHNRYESNKGITSLELLIEEFFISIFWAACLSSRGKIVSLSTLMVGTQQVHE
jgi:hypothetical protein